MSFTLWFTGLPASGKTTLAGAMARRLHDNGQKAQLLDSDDWAAYYRDVVPMDTLGRRIIATSMAVCACHLNQQGIPVFAAATTPLEGDRDALRALIPSFFLVYCHISRETAQHRDPKGLYALAAKGYLPDFPGPKGIYEPPSSPSLRLDTEDLAQDQCLERLIRFLIQKGLWAS